MYLEEGNVHQQSRGALGSERKVGSICRKKKRKEIPREYKINEPISCPNFVLPP